MSAKRLEKRISKIKTRNFQLEDQLAVITTISSDYDYLCTLNADTMDVIVYHCADWFKKMFNDDKGIVTKPEVRNTVLKNIIEPADFEAFCEASLHQNVLKGLMENGGVYHVNYRGYRDGKQLYYQTRYTIDPKDHKRIIIGIRSIDDHVRAEMARKELEFKAEEKDLRDSLAIQTALANKDALTGVRNTTAFQNKKHDVASRIAKGEDIHFAIAEFDVNDLKKMNDRFGHEQGDRFIQNCCKIICDIFKHSPVYRIGGDEFAAYLEGSDYINRNELIEQIRTFNEFNAKVENKTSELVLFATGVSEFDPDEDKSLDDVLKRADIDMYHDKKRLKNLGA